MPTPEQGLQHQEFVKALQHEAIPCGRSGCPGPVRATDLSQVHDRVKTFQFTCERCGWQDRVAGLEELSPPWDEASLQEMAYEHLMHLPAFCPFDHTPIVFISLPIPVARLGTGCRAFIAAGRPRWIGRLRRRGSR